jgi:hypothetical protein
MSPAAEAAAAETRLIVAALAAESPLSAETVAARTGLPLATVRRRLKNDSPGSSYRPRYVRNGAGLWGLTQAGRDDAGAP